MTADLAAIRIDAPAETVFAFMADPANLTKWSFGTWQTTIHDDGLIEGRALGSGNRILLRIDSDPDRLLIDYHLGSEAGSLRPRIFARVTPGSVTGHGTETSLLSLTALRGADMDDERWARLQRTHAAELDIVKSWIEAT